MAAGLLAAALAGCGGGSDGGTTTAAAPPATGTPSAGTTPNTTAMLAAAAADPAGTNTAANPAQAFALVQAPAAGNAAPVVVQSPPVVNFTVIDAAGKFVPGLTLVRAAGTADPACSTSATSTTGNVTVAMAKLNQPTDNSPSTWQSLISRQRYAADDLTARYATSDTAKLYPPTFRYAVAEGTTDPKPTATVTNPDGADKDPSLRIVGILEENTTGGYYTYRFAIDVVTPLLLADAVDSLNGVSGKVANNGNVAVKDGKTVHRVGMQLCYTDPASQAKVVVNPLFDFTLGADGIAVPVMAADGTTPTDIKKVVDRASCNECHSSLTAHGTRVDPNYCVICHNPGSTDYNTNNTIDLKNMIHKFHMGKDLTKDYQIVRAYAKGTLADAAATKIGFTFPQAPQNCVKCHDGSATASHPSAQGDNWKNVPSRNACGACHDGIDFSTGKGTTLGGATTGHIGGAKQDDTQCVLCHDATTIPIYHKDTTPTTADASKRSMSASISNVAVDAAGGVTVSFSVTDAGVAVTDSTKFTKPSFGLVKLVPAALGSSTYWVSYTARFRTKDAAKAPVLQSSNENAGTLSSNADGSFSYKFALPNGTTAGDIRTISHAHVLTGSAGPAADTTIGTWTWNALAKTWTEASTTGGANTGPNTVAYEPTLTHRVAMTFQKVGTPNVDNLTNAYFDFVPDGSAVQTTRNIVTMNTCATCHGGVKLHSGYATEYCVTCHNQLTLDPFTADPVDFQRLVHKLHRGKDLPSVVAGGSYVVNGTHNYSYSAFPGNITDCAVCHSATATKADGTTLLEDRNAWYTTPTQRACGTCHDDTAALDHIASNVTASGEQCTFCHNDTSAFGLGVRAVHKQ
ncbi:MAG: OmcA/MtrC family decaheme c-type cytochrome [Burkholderiales bacterium]|nr:OmcA/MtrC family decaheme c-type cytochrome [Burkholderiales bacterium]